MSVDANVKKQNYRTLIWIVALILGAALGALGCEKLNEFFNFIASAVFPYNGCRARLRDPGVPPPHPISIQED